MTKWAVGDWTEENLECALGLMLDRNHVRGAGEVRKEREKYYTKSELVGYALYLHTRGNLYADKEMDFDALRTHLMSFAKGRLREDINRRLRFPNTIPKVQLEDPTTGKRTSVSKENLKTSRTRTRRFT